MGVSEEIRRSLWEAPLLIGDLENTPSFDRSLLGGRCGWRILGLRRFSQTPPSAPHVQHRTDRNAPGWSPQR
jgi:hypothetical protein